MNMKLLAWAEAQFPSLSEAERRMLTAVNGQAAICGDTANDADQSNDPRFGSTWGESRTIRTSVIRWLCTQAGDLGRSPASGIYVYAAKISGDLNLSYALISCPLLFERCAIMGEISLKNAKVPSLILTGSCTRTVRADGIDVANNVLLNKGFHSRGEVLFRDAKIGGNLRTEDAKFEYVAAQGPEQNPGNSLGCDRIKVNGSIFLSKPGHGSTFKGEVGLANAFVGSNLECDGSTFENPNGIAMRADRIRVVGSVFLRNQFSAKGAVRFLNARIDVLDCSNGTFEGDGYTAFSAEAAKVSGYAVFDGAAIQRGGVQLRAITAGDLTFRAARLTSVDLRHATIRRELRLKRVVDPQHTAWDLRNAFAGSLDDDRESWPNSGNLSIQGFGYERFGSVFPDPHDDPAGCPTDVKSRISWLSLDGSGPPQSYKQLAQVYSKAGDTLSSRETLFRLEDRLHRRRLEETNHPVFKAGEWLWSHFLWATIGYGYKLSRSLWWLVLLGTLGYEVSYLGYTYKAITPTDKEAYAFFAQHGRAPDNYPRFSEFIFTVEHSVPAVNLGVSNSWSADGVAQTSGHPYLASCVRTWFYAQRLLGWLLSIFFLAGITGLVKSDR